MPSGTVKWFNNAKGFGFILPDEGDEDVFAHYSAIEMDGYRTLKAGQAVEFNLSQGEKGLHAVNIRLPSSTTEAQIKEQSSPNQIDESSFSDHPLTNTTEIPEIEGA